MNNLLFSEQIKTPMLGMPGASQENIGRRRHYGRAVLVTAILCSPFINSSFADKWACQPVGSACRYPFTVADEHGKCCKESSEYKANQASGSGSKQKISEYKCLPPQPNTSDVNYQKCLAASKKK